MIHTEYKQLWVGKKRLFLDLYDEYAEEKAFEMQDAC
jgi:hypothetical protein